MGEFIKSARIKAEQSRAAELKAQERRAEQLLADEMIAEQAHERAVEIAAFLRDHNVPEQLMIDQYNKTNVMGWVALEGVGHYSSDDSEHESLGLFISNDVSVVSLCKETRYAADRGAVEAVRVDHRRPPVDQELMHEYTESRLAQRLKNLGLA